MWKTAPKQLTFAESEAHVWRATLSVSDQTYSDFKKMLSQDEIEKATKLHFERDRRKSMISRAILKSILGRYLQIPPNEIEFMYGDQGKPFLSDKMQTTRISFNMAHSQGLALYAFSRNREIGVDLEEIRPIGNLDQIVKRHFSPNEERALSKLRENQKLEAFFQIWVCKEAYLKALGTGLDDHLNLFTIRLPIKSDSTAIVENKPQDDKQWFVHVVHPEQEFMGAVIVEGSKLNLRYFQFHHD